MSDIPREPTADECSSCAALEGGWFAVWYPQMGGYAGKAAVKAAGDCFDCCVWHDGQFPFSDDGALLPGEEARSPVCLHHCVPLQFVTFGEQVERLLLPDQE